MARAEISAAIVPFPTPRLSDQEIQTPTVSKHARLGEIRLPQIWKPMKPPQLEKRIY